MVLILFPYVLQQEKDKDSKREQKYKEAAQKYEETNEKLKTDLKEALRDGHPKFKEHYEKVSFSALQTFRIFSYPPYRMTAGFFSFIFFFFSWLLTSWQLVSAQKRAFAAWSSAASDLD
jgi:hypothetical protein